MSKRSRSKSSSGSLTPGSVLLLLLVLVIAAVFIWLIEDTDLLGPSPAPEPPTVESRELVTATPVPTAMAITPPGAAWYTVFFTRPIYPDTPANRGDSPLADRFVALLNSAQTSIDLAIYEFDLPAATQALVAAKKRGVPVRMVTDTDSVTSTDAAMSAAYKSLTAARIPIVEDGRSAIMHDKFAVVDGRWLWGGSWNFTIGDTYELNNNGIVIDSPELAANYTNEFRLMFEQHKFGPSKKQGALQPELAIGGTRVQNYFAPQDDVADKLVTLVNSAQKSIYFLAFQYTLDNLGAAMAARAQAGVTVSGVFERTGSQTPYSQFGKLQKLGLPVYQDGNPYIMHHKVIIVDEKTVAFGSYNFSTAAEQSNDENSLIIDDPVLAARFVQEFTYVRDVARDAAH